MFMSGRTAMVALKFKINIAAFVGGSPLIDGNLQQLCWVGLTRLMVKISTSSMPSSWYDNSHHLSSNNRSIFYSIKEMQSTP